MKLAQSLRARLMVLILTPLVIIACLLGYWRYAAALSTAEGLFDRALLAATLAISRDVTVSGGDALSITTRDLISEAAGGQVFYHVSGPDRGYVIGYGYPPVTPPGLDGSQDRPTFYESVYRGEPVRALRLLEQTETGPIRGMSTVTVWQRRADRQDFAVSLAMQSALLLSLLILSVGVVIWLSVSRGLRPLLDLEHAIAARTSDDLGGIRREVPKEVHGIVGTLNDLFSQVRGAIQARDAFISDAAHQLRNPVAGMLALAEAAETASNDRERLNRVTELRFCAERTARLTNQMLTFERLKARADEKRLKQLDLNELVTGVATRNAERALGANVTFTYDGPGEPVVVVGDGLMLEEAIENLIDNALRHGPPELTKIVVTLAVDSESAIVTVADNGKGLSPEDAAVAFERFGQVYPSEGSGLGLSIARQVAKVHGANLAINTIECGASISISIPIACGHAG